ncbi:hypothetical protein XELAEV_18043915mg [Xenopus laevis]|uniref:Uncharacterized protein n=1 Tax=Xenopus laevis TaxID=8355 RepID=A0A974H2T4_XENLA|nr:hypothetical protein XELAEV_18043915mg [Xenopus laevis]
MILGRGAEVRFPAVCEYSKGHNKEGLCHRELEPWPVKCYCEAIDVHWVAWAHCWRAFGPDLVAWLPLSPLTGIAWMLRETSGKGTAE